MPPAFVNTATTSSSAGATTLSQPVPAALVNGNILLALCSIKNNDVITVTGTGWIKLDQVNSGAGYTAALAWCLVNGTPPSCVFTWTNSVACRTAGYQYSGTLASPFGTTQSNTGSGATHSTTGFNTTFDGSRVIYVDQCAANTAMATPATWTENNDAGSSTALIRGVVGSKALSAKNTASGAISVTGGAADWVQWQLELLSASEAYPAGTRNQLMNSLLRM